MTLSESLLLLIIGALLGKVLDILIQKHRISSYEKALLEELEDIKQRLLWVCRSYESSIQLYVQGGVDHSLPLKLSNPIFKKHYSEVAIRLRASQRKSFSLIDAYIDSINIGINDLHARRNKVTKENVSELLEDWGSSLKAQYINASSAYWHVNYHLKNSQFPLLGEEENDVHLAYLEQIQSSENKVQEIINAARTGA